MDLSLIATVRPDNERQATVLLHDEYGNEIGSIVLTRVPRGIEVETWRANDTQGDYTLIQVDQQPIGA
jgi:hypothetical protein